MYVVCIQEQWERLWPINSEMMKLDERGMACVGKRYRLVLLRYFFTFTVSGSTCKSFMPGPCLTMILMLRMCD